MIFDFNQPITASDIINFLILIATIVAIIFGPIFALRHSRDHQNKVEQEKRQLAIFTTLLRTRKIELAPERVMALNTIPVEFYGAKNIIEAHQKYLGQLNSHFPSPDAPEAEAFHKELNDLMYDLLHAIGTHLNFNFDKRDLEKFAYSPQGWSTDDLEQKSLRKALIEIATGARPLSITTAENIPKLQVGKFPPKP